MRKRRVIAITALLACPVIVWQIVGALAWHSPVELKLIKVEQDHMLDGSGTRVLLLTIAATNRSNANVSFARNEEIVEVRYTNRWIKVDETWPRPSFGNIRAHENGETMFVVPSGTTGCRIQLKIVTRFWQERLWWSIGSGARSRIARVLPKKTVQWLEWPSGAPPTKSICLEIPFAEIEAATSR